MYDTLFASLPRKVKQDSAPMVERRTELNRRFHRKKKMAKLKAKLAAARDARERETILKKIHRLSPWWVEPKPAPAAAR